MNARDPVERLLQSAFDLWLADSPEARRACAALDGRCIAVELSDIRVSLSLLPGPDGLRVTLAECTPDARIRATGPDLLRMLRAGGAKSAPGRLHIDGDAEVAQRFRDLFGLVRFEPEERLSRLIGDVPAHELGRLWRGIAAFGRDTLRAVGDMAGEYLHYEARTLPTRHEIEGFNRAVDTLRDDVARAEARLLHAQHAPNRDTPA